MLLELVKVDLAALSTLGEQGDCAAETQDQPQGQIWPVPSEFVKALECPLPGGFLGWLLLVFRRVFVLLLLLFCFFLLFALLVF